MNADEMETAVRRTFNRRSFLKGSGLLVVGFSLAGCTPNSQSAATPAATPRSPATAVASEVAEQQPRPSPAASPPAVNQAEGAGRAAANQVDAWLAIAADGSVTVNSGRVELGTGVQTALAQIAADELDVNLARVTMVMGDTARTPDEGYTAGSKTIQIGGVAIRKAAAEARQALLSMAAERLSVGTDQLAVREGVVSVQSDPSRTVSYGDLMATSASTGPFPTTLLPRRPAPMRSLASRSRGSTCRGSWPGPRCTCRTCDCRTCCTAELSVLPASGRSSRVSTKARYLATRSAGHHQVCSQRQLRRRGRGT